MLKQVFNILSFIIVSTALNAQQFLPIYRVDSTTQSSIAVNGYGIVGHTAVQNEMAKKFIYGGNISSELIVDQLNNHNTTNRIGINVLAEIEYRHAVFLKNKFPNLGWSAKVGQHLVAGANYSRDTYQLLFQGNMNVDNLNLDNLNLNTHYFSKIGFGLFSKKNQSSVHLNLIGAHAFTDFYTRTASYSNTDNNMLNFSMDGALSTAGSSSTLKGWGLGIDAAFYVPFGLNNDRFKGVLSFKVNNLGAVLFNSSVNRQVDTTISYTGFSFTQLTNLSNFDQQKIEDTLGVRLDTTSTLTLLPTFIKIGKEVDLNDVRKFQSFFGTRLMPTLAYLPQVYAGLHWRINEAFNAGSQMMYGGFSNLKFGLYGSYMSKSLNLSLGTEDIIGLLSEQGRGASAVIRAIWSF